MILRSDNGKTSRYTYNAAGERIMKSNGTMEGVYINGAPQGITFHETDNLHFILQVSSLSTRTDLRNITSLVTNELLQG